MTAADRLAPDRPEVYRPKGETSGGDGVSRIGRVLDRMRPDEGWASVPLVLLLAGAMAWSIADARWILNSNDLTSYLVWVALAAALWGYLSARLDLSPWLAHALGCTMGAFILIEAIGASLPGSTPGLVGWFSATASSVTQAYLDLTWRHQVSTLQVGHFCLILGILVWGTAQAASYDIFGYHRAVNGVLLLAVVLVANMSLTGQNQFYGLVVFSAAALVLLLLAHAADERSSWLRHRIWRGRDFQAPHMQGGLAFASAAVAGSLVLTIMASSAPLAPAFRDMGTHVSNAFGWVEGFLPGGANSRYQASSDFGNTAPISARFSESTREVFTVRVSTGAVSPHWRLVAYDTFQTTGWALGPNSHQDQLMAGGTVGRGTPDQVGPTTPGRIQVSVSVQIQDTSIKHVVVPNEPDSVNVPVQRTLIGSGPEGAYLAWLTTDATQYTVNAYVPDYSSGDGLTEWKLEHAGTDYPSGLQARYTQGTDQLAPTGEARKLLVSIEAWAHGIGNPFSNPFDIAKAIQDYLQNQENFQYNADITRLMPGCTGLSTPDCFAFLKQGFCEQYATTMAMLLRLKGVPARYVQGYLPGEADPHSLIQQVTSQQKHAWVEVFFPTYGWIPFDPTGGGIGRPTLLEPGSAATPSPSSSGSPGASEPDETVGPRRTPQPQPTKGGSDSGSGLLAILVPGILVAVIGLALFVLWRRRPGRPEGPEAIYRNVVRLASRVGYKPQPTQTVYEYTGMLADVVPTARDSLGVVAMAAVEVTYGRRQLGSDRLISLSAAHRVIRQALLRLMLRLPGRRGRGEGKATADKGRGGRGRRER